MRATHPILLVVPAALILAAAGPASAQDMATIQGLNDRFTALFNAGDGAGVAGLYTDEATILPPGAPRLTGRAAIETFWSGASRQFGDMTLTTAEVTPLGPDAAREIGRFTLKPRSTPAGSLAGKYVVIWQRTASGWKLATDIWNTDQ
ncbi:hypothetical protein OPKNFCMD_6507 [Methylobacterium crusticola]|uniref:DUF4440 domain-containing protein n=1 Tax=Methylobacterium crusticola TaxID=1697972 RepID=A0ABQ4R930_9HYPH|nr:DUF4440 domain-containing protein [Methylobacterium crusticola]GJD53729.1 hypothetical protein OPKNFCMD_6507 [Methylobacterium crusticola]